MVAYLARVANSQSAAGAAAVGVANQVDEFKAFFEDAEEDEAVDGSGIPAADAAPDPAEGAAVDSFLHGVFGSMAADAFCGCGRKVLANCLSALSLSTRTLSDRARLSAEATG